MDIIQPSIQIPELRCPTINTFGSAKLYKRQLHERRTPKPQQPVVRFLVHPVHLLPIALIHDTSPHTPQ
jgi:hypothetical protein